MNERTQASKLCKTELKKEFPLTKFSVVSESFAGGDALRISWDWLLGPTRDEVQAITDKYECAKYDIMSDSWEIKKGTIPQVSYIVLSRA